MRIHRFLPLLFAIIVLLTSCNNPFRPELKDVSGIDDEQLNSTPEKLLRNLERAYQEKNIDLYLSLLHPDFRFELIALS